MQHKFRDIVQHAILLDSNNESARVSAVKKLGGGGSVFVMAVIVVSVAVAFLRSGDGSMTMAVTPALTAPASTPTSAQVPLPTPALPDLTPQEERNTIVQVRDRWRAESGETVDEIVNRVGKVAHFILRGPWEAYRDFDGRPSAGIAFVRSKATPSDEALTIYWRVEMDGSVTTASRGFRAIDLGSHALALELIQSEIDDDVRGANSRYLYDPRNLDYLKTDAGPLSDLLTRHRCTPSVALHAAGFTPKESVTGHDQWTFDTTINCKSAGARYCVDGGVIAFRRYDRETWQPATTCARMLVGQEPEDFMKPFMRDRVR